MSEQSALALKDGDWMKCKMCNEVIPDPREAEIDSGICVLCLDDLADDVDEGSITPDEFTIADEENKEMKLNVR